MVEFVTILLSGLFTLVSPVGIVADQLAEGLIRERIVRAELLDVRIDNTPNFQIVNGRVDRVRLAGRGVYPVPELRIDTLDVETDTIDLDMQGLRQGRIALDEPLQSAAHLILKADDLNALLQSPRVQQLLERLTFNLPGERQSRLGNRYRLTNPRLVFLGGDRLRVLVDLQDQVLQERTEAVVETGLQIIDGHQLTLVNPTITVDGQPVPRQLITTFVDGAEPELTLKQLEDFGITARVIQFEITPEAFDLAVFLRVDPTSPLLNP
ncbi:MAG: DUF2993 domain-containing protein [Cyanobacteria bacterium]|nr:DUF2993 domain-containing protein [Cyanobacteriota bacterium]